MSSSTPRHPTTWCVSGERKRGNDRRGLSSCSILGAGHFLAKGLNSRYGWCLFRIGESIGGCMLCFLQHLAPSTDDHSVLSHR